jgi:hypothetical protein
MHAQHVCGEEHKQKPVLALFSFQPLALPSWLLTSCHSYYGHYVTQ